MKKKKIEE